MGTVNIADFRVRVKLSLRGDRLVANNGGKFRPLDKTPDGWSEWDLPTLMKALGPQMVASETALFSPDIQIRVLDTVNVGRGE